jgi:hypothetical protein
VGRRFAVLEVIPFLGNILRHKTVLKEIERGETAMKQRKKQPESPQASSHGPTAPPAQETARLQAQSTLASKGFF